MIIVSQDKKGIYNFDNINAILVIGTNIKSFDNTSVNLENAGDLLGTYKTEERAKEVLIEIIQSHINSENYKYVNRPMTTEELNRLQKGLVCEMPEE